MEPVEHEDSDTEEDPARLLNQWLGELNTLKRVSLTNSLKITFYQCRGSGSIQYISINYPPGSGFRSIMMTYGSGSGSLLRYRYRKYQRMKEISEKKKVQYLIILLPVLYTTLIKTENILSPPPFPPFPFK